jgi:PAS domain S-box-containing protein
MTAMTAQSDDATTGFALNPQFLDLLPAAAYICDAEGIIRYCNPRAVELWGREPRCGDADERFCGSFRLFDLDGSPLPHDRCPMAEVLRTGQPQRDREAIIERPDGSRIAVLINIGPLRDESGLLVGALNVFQDITEKERLYDKQQRSEAQFRQLISALPAAVYTTDREGYITLFNDRAADLWGRRPDIGKEMWCGSFRIFRPDGTPLPLDQCPMAVALREGHPVLGQEIVVKRPDGTRAYVLPHPVPLRDASGEAAGAVNMLVDITERKRAEEELARSEERFRSAFAHALVGMAFTDLQGRFLQVNDAYCEITGYTEEEHRRLDFASIIHPADRERHLALIRQLSAGDIPSFFIEKRYVRKDGEIAWVKNSVSLLRDPQGRPANIITLTLDITGQKQAEHDRRLLSAIVESSNDAIISKSLDGTITSWNRAAERMYGYTAEEVIGRNVSLLMPQDHLEDMTQIIDHIRLGERVAHYETQRKARDGRIIDVSLTVSPIRDDAGNIVGASKIARDITGRKRAEEAIKRSEEQLREANRRKDEFLAMLAHELRNPLSAINSAVQVARRTDVAESLEWSQEVIERQVTHLARLIDDLLDVSRITRGKIQLRKAVVDAVPILNSAVETVRPLIEDRKHELTVSFRAGPLHTKADPVRLEQVVVNLLTNAAKYTESGGRIWLTAERVGSEVVLQVEDNGIGIAPEKLPQMFELFAQGDRALARSEGGLGIGLTLVKRLVEMHHGTIHASSEGPGKGSRFVVRLPAAEESPSREVPAVAPKTTGRNGKPASRILVVDDNADGAKGLARLLKLLGHDVRTASDGPEAIEAARAYRPDIVLLDIGLPGIDGYEVARRLREDERCRSSVIIAVSGYGQEEDRRRAREAGFDHHLVKPIDHDALISVLSKR